MRLIAVHRRDNADRKMVQRYDRAEAQLDPASRTPQGYLRAHAAVAVPGVMEYVDDKGKVTRELIPADELHKVDSLRTLASVPTTLGHPDGDVTPDNVGQLATGDVGEQVDILSDTGHVRVTMVVRRKDALDAAGTGTIEVSPGYKCFIDPTPGVDPVFGPYDAIQRDRVYNHVAQVDEARGGDTVKLRVDERQAKAVLAVAAFPNTTPRVERHDGVIVRRFDSAPSTNGDRSMDPKLLALAKKYGIGHQRADGKIYAKADAETPMTADDLIAAIDAAIQAYKAQAAAAPSASQPPPAAGQTDVAALQAENAALKDQLAGKSDELAAAKTDEKKRADAAAKTADEAEQKRLDGIADKLEFDREARWRADTKTLDRKIDLLRHAEVLKKDEKAPSEPEVNGMLRMLERDSSERVDDAGETEARNDWSGMSGERAPRDDQERGDELSARDRRDMQTDPWKVGLRKSVAAANAPRTNARH